MADLKLKAAEQQEKLAEKQSKANAALDMISNTMENANTQKQEMEILKRNTENENEQLSKRSGVYLQILLSPDLFYLQKKRHRTRIG